jgi:hypothetical protein
MDERIFKFEVTCAATFIAYVAAADWPTAENKLQELIDLIEYCCPDADFEDAGFDHQGTHWNIGQIEMMRERAVSEALQRAGIPCRATPTPPSRISSSERSETMSDEINDDAAERLSEVVLDYFEQSRKTVRARHEFLHHQPGWRHASAGVGQPQT